MSTKTDSKKEYNKEAKQKIIFFLIMIYYINK